MTSTELAFDQICSSSWPSPLRRSCALQSPHECDMRLLEKMVVGSRRVARHAALYRKHDLLSMLYLVRFGQFKLTAGELNEQRVAQFHMAGELMGLDAIATGRHNLGTIALESSEVYEIPFVAMVKAMRHEPAIQYYFLQAMSQAINIEHGRSCLLAAPFLDQRFAGFLLRLGEKYARLGYSDKSYRLSMSRGEIGSYLGISIESISRVIARFNAHGAVSISGRMVELRDRPYLQSLACGDSQFVRGK